MTEDEKHAARIRARFLQGMGAVTAAAILRARSSNTPLIVWRDGTMQRIDPNSVPVSVPAKNSKTEQPEGK